jgi:NitT/TauT family transport system substrate-binding protein
LKKLILVLLLCCCLVDLAAAQPLQKVTVGGLRGSAGGSFFIALERGHFRARGLDAQYVDFTAASQLPSAIMSGDVDFAFIGYTAAFFNLAAKGAMKIVASRSSERPGFDGLGFIASKRAYDGGFRKLPDMAGKRIAITTTGSSTQYAVERVAQKYSIDRNSYTLVPVQTVPNLAAAVKGGQVDMGVVTAVVVRTLEAEGAGKAIGWLGEEAPAEFGGVITSTRMIQQHRDLVQTVVNAYVAGATEFHRAFNQVDASGKRIKGPGYDELLPVLARALQQPEAIVVDSITYADPLGRIDVKDIYEQVDIWKSLGFVDKNANTKDMLDLSFVEGHFNVPK